MITNLGDGCEICRRPKLAGALCAACAAGSDVPVPNQDRASGDRIVSTETIEVGDRIRHNNGTEGTVAYVQSNGWVRWFADGYDQGISGPDAVRLVAKASYAPVASPGVLKKGNWVRGLRWGYSWGPEVFEGLVQEDARWCGPAHKRFLRCQIADTDMLVSLYEWSLAERPVRAS